MAKRDYTFGKSERKSLEITPLGAAIVEAMPDRTKVARVKSLFKNKKQCPVSMIFDKKGVEAFYKERGEKIAAIFKA